MGASRRAHHAQQTAMRAATAEANRFAEMQRAEQERLKALAEALKPQPAQYEAPDSPIRSTLADTNVGVRTARSKRATTTGMAKGIAALRIPLNIGGGAGSGLNIG